MNRGATLDEVLHSVSAPAELLAKPYLRPQYDDPEFVVRAIWHLYGGWFDANPAHLKPAPAAELAAELAALAGGAERLAERAAALARGGGRDSRHTWQSSRPVRRRTTGQSGDTGDGAGAVHRTEDIADGPGVPGRLPARRKGAIGRLTVPGCRT